MIVAPAEDAAQIVGGVCPASWRHLHGGDDATFVALGGAGNVGGLSIWILTFLIVVLAAATGLPLVLLVGADKLVQARWRRTAKRMSLTFSPGPITGSDFLTGQIGDYPLAASNEFRRQTHLVLDLEGSVPEELHLSRRSWGFVYIEESILTGDTDFDRAVFAGGPRVEVTARLDRRARTLLRDLILSPPYYFTAQVELRGAQLIYTAPRVISSPKRLQRILGLLTSIADSLRLEESLPAALCANACDPLEPVRVRVKNLQALIDVYPGAEETNDAAEEALRARSWLLRFTGGRHLVDRPEGREALLDLVRAEAAPSRLRSAALDALADLSGRFLSDNLLLEVSRAKDAALRITAARLLTERGTQLCLARLVEMARDSHAMVVQRVASLLATARTPDAEETLIALLDHENIDVVRTAAQALSTAGSIRAVESLLGSSQGYLVDPKLRVIARRSIRMIQARLHEANPGHLSLADPSGAADEIPTGAVSLAPREGALSLKTEG